MWALFFEARGPRAVSSLEPGFRVLKKPVEFIATTVDGCNLAPPTILKKLYLLGPRIYNMVQISWIPQHSAFVHSNERIPGFAGLLC